MNKLFSSATFVSHYIALQFEQNKKKPFRNIFQDVLKQCVKLPHIVGIRIAIAGRINGAEMARGKQAVTVKHHYMFFLMQLITMQLLLIHHTVF